MATTDTTSPQGDDAGAGFGGKKFARRRALHSSGWLAVLTGIELAVYDVLDVAAGRDGRAWPSATFIAKTIGHQDTKRVRDAFRQLIAYGLIELVEVGGGNKANTFRMLEPTPAQIDPGSNRPTHPGSNRPALNKEEHRVEHITKHTSKHRAPSHDISVPIPPSLDTPAFRDAWSIFMTHRKEIKNKLTPTAARLRLNELEAMGVDRAIAAIKHSVSNGWTGIFEDHKNGNPNGKSHRNVGNFAETISLPVS